MNSSLFETLEPRERLPVSSSTLDRCIAEVYQWFRECCGGRIRGYALGGDDWRLDDRCVVMFRSMVSERWKVYTGREFSDSYQISDTSFRKRTLTVRKNNYKKIRDSLSILPDGGELGTIYAVSVAVATVQGRVVKLGYTSDKDLMRYLQRSYGELDFKLLASRGGTKQQEQMAHNRWKEYRVHKREWYRPNPELMSNLAEFWQPAQDFAMLWKEVELSTSKGRP